MLPGGHMAQGEGARRHGLGFERLQLEGGRHLREHHPGEILGKRQGLDVVAGEQGNGRFFVVGCLLDGFFLGHFLGHFLGSFFRRGGGLLHGDHHRLRLGGLRRRQERRGQKHCQQQRCDPHENGLLHMLSSFAPAYAAAGGGMTGRFCSLTLFRDGIIIIKITFCIFCRADVRALMGAN